jgi:hypothetical protein
MFTLRIKNAPTKVVDNIVKMPSYFLDTRNFKLQIQLNIIIGND